MTDDIIRVMLHSDGNHESDSSLCVNYNSSNPAVTFVDNTNYFEYGTKKIKIVIQKDPVRFTYYRGDTIVCRDLEGFFKEGGYRGVKMELSPGEKIYGTGSRALPPDRRGYDFIMYNKNQQSYEYGTSALNTCIPVFFSSRLYGLYFDNHTYSLAHIGTLSDSLFQYYSVANKFSYYYISGNSNNELLANYCLLTGRQPLLPRWAMGYFQSKYAYIDQETVLNSLGRMRAEGFPIDVVVHDLYWFNRMGDFEWSPSRFPDYGKMVDSALSMGIKTILISECYISKNSKNFQDASDKGLFPLDDSGKPEDIVILGDNCRLLDITNDTTPSWLWRKYRERTKDGVAGWWIDLVEPELHSRYINFKAGRGYIVHNIYSLLWLKMLYEGYVKDFPNTRPFIMTRSGWAGMQRYGTVSQCGDEARTFQGLKGQIPVMLGMSMSGASYMHSDGGGFQGKDSNPRSELYARWLQFNAFQPIMRVHMDSTAPAEPYNYPDSIKDIAREYIRLRYSLLPYNYTLAWENSEFSRPLAAPMNFYYPFDERLSNISDQYFWGPSFIVAPVTDSSITGRDIVLPEGTWINYHTGERISGNQTVFVEAPLSTLPLFVRSGSFIPKTPPVMSTEEYDSDSLIVDYYPDPSLGETGFRMYDDDGRTPGANLLGKYELLCFNGTASKDEIIITAHKEGNSYEGAPASRNIIFNIINTEFKPSSVIINGQITNITESGELFLQGKTVALFDSVTKRIKVKFDWPGDSSVIIISNLPSAIPDESNKPGFKRMIVSALPNPFTESVEIKYYTEDRSECELLIIDCTGRKVHSERLSPAPGMNSFSFFTESIAGGTYFVLLKSHNTIDSIKLIKISN